MTAIRPLRPAIAEWPACSSSLVFIWEAIQLAGKAKFGPEWAGDEIDALDWPVSPEQEMQNAAKARAARAAALAKLPGHVARTTFPAENNHNAHVLARGLHIAERLHERMAAHQQAKWESNQQALKRLQSTVAWLHERFREGEIATYARYVTGGYEPQLMPASEWYCEGAFETRFLTGEFERWTPTQPPRKFAVYLFVDRAGLDAAISKLAHAALVVSQQDLAALPEPLKIAIRIALADPSITAKTQGEREAAAAKAWRQCFPGNQPSQSYVEAIGGVLGTPDLEKIRQQQERARGSAAKK